LFSIKKRPADPSEGKRIVSAGLEIQDGRGEDKRWGEGGVATDKSIQSRKKRELAISEKGGSCLEEDGEGEVGKKVTADSRGPLRGDECRHDVHSQGGK